jgi:hypothetical protein
MTSRYSSVFILRHLGKACRSMTSAMKGMTIKLARNYVEVTRGRGTPVRSGHSHLLFFY